MVRRIVVNTQPCQGETCGASHWCRRCEGRGWVPTGEPYELFYVRNDTRFRDRDGNLVNAERWVSEWKKVTE